MEIIGKFPNILEQGRIATLGKYEKLYDGHQFAVLGLHDKIKKQYKNLEDIIYLSHALPARISEFYGDFVQGDVEDMVIRAGTGEKEHEDFVESVVYENDLKEKIYDFAVNQSKFGFVVLLGWLDDEGIYHIDEVAADQYFPQPDGSVIFATYKKDPSDNLQKKLLLYVQHYKMENGVAKIFRSAYRCNDAGVATDRVELSLIGNMLGRELKEEENLEIDELPIRQIDNGKRTKWGYGKSDYFDIIPNLSEVNERSTHISTQLLKNLDAKLIIPKEMLSDTGSFDSSKDTFGLASKDEVMPAYLINQNPLLTDTREQITSELKFISFITGVPMFELLKSAMPERVEALRIQMFSAMRKTTTKRNKIRRGIMDMIRIGFKMKSIDFNQDIVMQMSDVLPTDPLNDTQIEVERVNSGLSSRKSSIMRLDNIDEEDAETEINRIAEEDRIAGVSVNVNNPPQL